MSQSGVAISYNKGLSDSRPAICWSMKVTSPWAGFLYQTRCSWENVLTHLWWPSPPSVKTARIPNGDMLSEIKDAHWTLDLPARYLAQRLNHVVSLALVNDNGHGGRLKQWPFAWWNRLMVASDSCGGCIDWFLHAHILVRCHHRFVSDTHHQHFVKFHEYRSMTTTCDIRSCKDAYWEVCPWFRVFIGQYSTICKRIIVIYSISSYPWYRRPLKCTVVS